MSAIRGQSGLDRLREKRQAEPSLNTRYGYKPRNCLAPSIAKGQSSTASFGWRQWHTIAISDRSKDFRAHRYLMRFIFDLPSPQVIMAANLALGISPNDKSTFRLNRCIVSLSHSVNSVDGTYTTFIDAPSHFSNTTLRSTPCRPHAKEKKTEVVGKGLSLVVVPYIAATCIRPAWHQGSSLPPVQNPEYNGHAP